MSGRDQKRKTCHFHKLIFSIGSLVRSLRSRGCRRAQGPRQREDALSRLLRGYGHAVVPRSASLRDARPVGFIQARRGGGRLRFPPPWFSPGSPIPGPAPVGLRPRLRPRAASGRRPLFMRIIGRGENPSPFGRLSSLTGGNRTAASFPQRAGVNAPSYRKLQNRLSKPWCGRRAGRGRFRGRRGPVRGRRGSRDPAFPGSGCGSGRKTSRWRRRTSRSAP